MSTADAGTGGRDLAGPGPGARHPRRTAEAPLSADASTLIDCTGRGSGRPRLGGLGSTARRAPGARHRRRGHTRRPTLAARIRGGPWLTVPQTTATDRSDRAPGTRSTAVGRPGRRPTGSAAAGRTGRPRRPGDGPPRRSSPLTARGHGGPRSGPADRQPLSARMPATARIAARRIDRCRGREWPGAPRPGGPRRPTARRPPARAAIRRRPGHRPRSGPRPGGGYRPDRRPTRRSAAVRRMGRDPISSREPTTASARPYDDRPRRDFGRSPAVPPGRRPRPSGPARPRVPARPGVAGHGATGARPGAGWPARRCRRQTRLAADEELVAGRRPVEEAFVGAPPGPPPAGRPAAPRRRSRSIVLHATSLRIPIVEVEGGSLTALAGFDGHQGVALVVEPRRFATLDDVLARAAERGEPPFVLVLDSLEDPHNVGLAPAQRRGRRRPRRPVPGASPGAADARPRSRRRPGAVEHLLLCPVDDLASALVDLHGHGVWVAGADGDAPLTARQTDLRGPIAIVVGSEGQGLGPAVRKRCDLFVRIPMRGAIGSLNAAVAGSVLLFEVAAQRDPDGTAGRSVARNVRCDVVDPADAAAEAEDGQPGAVVERADARSRVPKPSTSKRKRRQGARSDRSRAPKPEAASEPPRPGAEGPKPAEAVPPRRPAERRSRDRAEVAPGPSRSRRPSQGEPTAPTGKAAAAVADAKAKATHRSPRPRRAEGEGQRRTQSDGHASTGQATNDGPATEPAATDDDGDAPLPE